MGYLDTVYLLPQRLLQINGTIIKALLQMDYLSTVNLRLT